MDGEIYDNNIYGFEDHIGETVTIFTTCGGQSGAGFTGVVIKANPCFVRLVTRIGPPPSCSLGNACSGFGNSPWGSGWGCCGRPGNIINTVGSVVDIPVNRIAAVVFNTV